MSNADFRGRFVWHELMTTDPGAAGAFYPKVVGWRTQPMENMPSYTLWVGRGGPLGGLMALEGSGSPFWLPYIGTPDVDATARDVERLGGRILKEPTDIPDVGRFAVFADPQGATFAVYRSASDVQAPDGPPQTGEFSWHELATTDYRAALRFYQELFGWEESEAHDMGPLGVYQLFAYHGRQVGGMYNKMPDMPGPPHWMCYVKVDDVRAAVSAAKSGGGRVLNGPMEVPGGDWIAQIADPQGAVFAVHMTRQAAQEKSAGRAPPRERVEGRSAAGSGAAARPAAKKSARKSAARRSKPAKKSARRAAKKAARKTARKAARKTTSRAAARRKAAGRSRSARKRATPRTRVKSSRKSSRKAAARRGGARRGGAKRPARRRGASRARRR